MERHPLVSAAAAPRSSKTTAGAFCRQPGHWSTWQAARVEVTQQQEAAEREQNPIEDKVVDKIVERTEIAPASTNVSF
jgi:hypothetical protein